ncbi:cytochrome c biogenesis CcdA family protein [Ornithinibacillus sp. 4-3]|uniref:Cytochrome c biogenesis CcdA family protein n=1 Tax=Ornithinibacillus sp. 4-3 TaxID=3231488 RepID=A0AB39HQK3_9BACI
MSAVISVLMAFGGGVLSFVSPCTLPLYPAFLSYITGMSVGELKENRKFNSKAFLHTIFFLLGFSVVFIMIGFAYTNVTAVSDFLMQYKDLFRQLGAILMVFFGLVIIGVFNFQFLMKERKITFKNRPAGFIGSFIIGLAFSMGWTPCIGPILMGIFGKMLDEPQLGMVMMISYVLGFSIPFLILSFFIGRLDWIKRHSVRLMKIGGYIMILLGIALFFDWMTAFTSFLANWFGWFGF